MTDKQPLNEAYKNEVLEAYQKISDTFNDFTLLMRKRVPYDEWPKHCKIAGVSEELMGKAPPDIEETFKADIAKHSKDVMDELDKAILYGWPMLQSDCRPDQSFRAMIGIMKAWKKYMDRKEKKENQFTSIKKKILSMIDDCNPRVNCKCQIQFENLWDLYRMVTKKEAECEE